MEWYKSVLYLDITMACCEQEIDQTAWSYECEHILPGSECEIYMGLI